MKIIPPRKRGGMIFYMALLRGVEEPQIALPAGYESSTQAKSKIILLNLIVWRFLGYDYVVNVALFKTGAGNLDKARLLPKLFDCSASDIAHSGAQPADELIYV